MIMQRTGLTLLTESWQAFANCVEQCVQCFQTRRMFRPRLSADCVSVRTIHRRHDQRTAWHRYLVAGGRSRRASVLSATNHSHLPDLTSRVRRPHQRLLLLGAGMGSWLSTDTTAGSARLRRRHHRSATTCYQSHPPDCNHRSTAMTHSQRVRRRSFAELESPHSRSRRPL